MARIRFLTDEHIATAVATGLRARGIDGATAGESGRLGAADITLLASAGAEGRVLITDDPDFLRLHASGVPHEGIVFVPRDAPVGVVIAGAMLIAEVLTSDDMKNHVEFL